MFTTEVEPTPCQTTLAFILPETCYVLKFNGYGNVRIADFNGSPVVFSVSRDVMFVYDVMAEFISQSKLGILNLVTEGSKSFKCRKYPIASSWKIDGIEPNADKGAKEV